MRLRSSRIITPAGVRAGIIVISEGLIADVVLDGAGRSSETDIDFGDAWLAPGFLDLHVHGGGGAQCNTSDADEIRAVARFHARHGTTGLLATAVAAPVAELESSLAAIRRCVGDGSGTAAVLGAHLEGPFLSRTYPGAMNPEQFLDPDRAIWERLLAGAPGDLAMMTLAPELPGALELTAALAEAGVVASLGHTDADYDDAVAAVQAGATAVTHLFNAMRPMHHRDPGVVGAALDLPGLSCELICDGIHVKGPMLRIALRSKGLSGVRLVTDAIAAAGMPDGDYRLGSEAVAVRGGRATAFGGERLAGSTLTMAEAVRNAVWMLGVTVEDAVVLASVNPARLIGLADRKGAIVAGFDADLVALGDDLDVRGTMVGGTWLVGPT
jgi:N-acetylglucosamine-6-phosphate deacetylase